jgi:hypothetical protein
MSLLPQVIAWRHEKIVTFFLQIVIFNLLWIMCMLGKLKMISKSQS